MVLIYRSNPFGTIPLPPVKEKKMEPIKPNTGWSDGELALLGEGVKKGLAPSEIKKLFPSRSKNSVLSRIRRTKRILEAKPLRDIAEERLNVGDEILSVTGIIGKIIQVDGSDVVIKWVNGHASYLTGDQGYKLCDERIKYLGQPLK